MSFAQDFFNSVQKRAVELQSSDKGDLSNAMTFMAGQLIGADRYDDEAISLAGKDIITSPYRENAQEELRQIAQTLNL